MAWQKLNVHTMLTGLSDRRRLLAGASSIESSSTRLRFAPTASKNMLEHYTRVLEYSNIGQYTIHI
jgi:hypothetical protein